MLKYGNKRSQADNTLFVKSDTVTTPGVYVDDIIVIGNDEGNKH